MHSCRFVDGRAHIVKGFNMSAFYEVLAEVVAARNTTWRLAGLETGVPSATVRRMARGECPDASALAALSAWAGLNPAEFVVVSPGWTTSDPLTALSTILRSDPDLEAAAARDLETIIRLAYANI